MNVASRQAARIIRYPAVPVLALACLHFAFASIVGERPLAAYFTRAYIAEIAMFLFIPWIGWLIFAFWQAIRARAASPARFIGAKLAEQRVRFANAAGLLLAYALINRSYRAIKVAIPRLNEFYADPIFVEWDRWLFGTDPWRISHSLFGQTATQVFDWAYFVWVTVVLVAYAAAAFARDPRVQFQACMTYLLVWIVMGNVLAVALSSAGPCYYDDFFGSDYFRPLMAKLEAQDLAAIRVQSFLLTTSGDEAIGTGISAMPSVHCGLSMFIVLFVNRVAGWEWALPALAYHIVILIASVHLGWHYAVDGLLSTLLVPAIWWIVGIATKSFGMKHEGCAA